MTPAASPLPAKRRLRRWLCILAGTAGLLLCALLTAFLLLPSLAEVDSGSLENLEQTLILYDKDGQAVAGIWDSQNRIRVPLSEIPLHVQQAFIAIEDARFYQHHGVDLRRILGAVVADVKAGSYVQGASTISQQIIKLTHLTTAKKLSRKLMEVVLAFQLERTYTKDEILEMYLNLVYFGNGCYGIEAAAQSYFGKPARELTLAEGALLAGVVKGPSLYAPHIDLDRSLQRRNVVLQAMKTNGFIEEDAYQQACEEPCLLQYSQPVKYVHSDYVDVALREAQEILGVDYETLLTNGYRIYTGMDTALQTLCEEAMEDDSLFPDASADGTQPEAGLVILNTQDATAAALIGGRSYQHGDFHHATQSMRSPGSAIKPVLVYAPAMESFDYTPATAILDAATDFSGYQPRNASYQFHGWVSLRESLVNSYNIPAVKVLQQIGVSQGKAYAASVGIPFAEDDNHLALALGGMSQGVTLLQLTGSYLPFAREGFYDAPHCITRIEDPHGRVLYRREDGSQRVLSPETAYLITDILQDTVASGTARRLQLENVPLAAKTGSVSYENLGIRDAYLVAYNPDLVAGVWMGFDRTDSQHMLASHAGGGSYPALLLKHILSRYYEGKTGPDFVRPSTVVQADLDRVVYESTQTCQLATRYTPENQRYTELFRRSDVPTVASLRCQPPQAPANFRAWINYACQPTLQFTAERQDAAYMLYRAANGGPYEQVAIFQGVEGTVTWSDTAAPSGTLSYRVIPCLPEVLVGGKPLQGRPSLVLQVRIPRRASGQESPRN